MTPAAIAQGQLDVARTPDGERFEVAAIYTTREDKIARVDFVKR